MCPGVTLDLPTELDVEAWLRGGFLRGKINPLDLPPGCAFRDLLGRCMFGYSGRLLKSKADAGKRYLCNAPNVRDLNGSFEVGRCRTILPIPNRLTSG